jgi:hypothetical protein
MLDAIRLYSSLSCIHSDLAVRRFMAEENGDSAFGDRTGEVRTLETYTA